MVAGRPDVESGRDWGEVEVEGKKRKGRNKINCSSHAKIVISAVH